MNWFRRKQKSRPYPAVYSEWSVEFRRISDTKRPMTEADATQLSDGVLQDGKYTKEAFGRDLVVFLEEQIKVFFEAYGLGIDACIQAGDPHYLVLTMQRHTRLYQNLFFFESLAFLKQDEVERLKKELQEKLQKFHEEVLAYVQKMSEYATQMTPVITHIRRLI